MINGEKVLDHPIRWAMVGGGRGSQIGYIHRSAALRDNSFRLVAGAFDINPARGRDFGTGLGVSPERCYPDYRTLFAEETGRPDGIEAVSIATPNGTHYEIEGEAARLLERGSAYLYPSALAEDRIGGGHPEGLFEAWSNLYLRFAKAMQAAGQKKTIDFWYPDIHAAANGVKWVEKCVESSDKGAVWVDY